MKQQQFKVGDTVRFNAPTGSWGKIEAPRGYDDGWYVRFDYGKDVFGKAITTLSSVSCRQLVPVSRELYRKYVACRAWSDDQKLVQAELETAKFEKMRF